MPVQRFQAPRRWCFLNCLLTPCFCFQSSQVLHISWFPWLLSQFSKLSPCILISVGSLGNYVILNLTDTLLILFPREPLFQALSLFFCFLLCSFLFFLSKTTSQLLGFPTHAELRLPCCACVQGSDWLATRLLEHHSDYPLEVVLGFSSLPPCFWLCFWNQAISSFQLLGEHMFSSYCLCILLIILPVPKVILYCSCPQPYSLAPVLPSLSHFFCLLPTCLLAPALDMSKYIHTIFMFAFLISHATIASTWFLSTFCSFPHSLNITFCIDYHLAQFSHICP